MPIGPNFDDFLSYNNFNNNGLSNALFEMVAKNSLKELIKCQRTFYYIIQQAEKLKTIHTDIISKDILNDIQNKCKEFLPKE